MDRLSTWKEYEKELKWRALAKEFKRAMRKGMIIDTFVSLLLSLAIIGLLFLRLKP